MKPTITHEMLQIATASHERLMSVLRMYREGNRPRWSLSRQAPKRKEKYVKQMGTCTGD